MLNVLEIVMVAIIPQTVWGMAMNPCPDKERARIAVSAVTTGPGAGTTVHRRCLSGRGARARTTRPRQSRSRALSAGAAQGGEFAPTPRLVGVAAFETERIRSHRWSPARVWSLPAYRPGRQSAHDRYQLMARGIGQTPRLLFQNGRCLRGGGPGNRVRGPHCRRLQSRPGWPG